MSPAPILAVSGSLRSSSVNTAALRAAVAAGAAHGIAIDLSDAVRSLPHFDPDLEAALPDAVVRFDRACAEAAGLLISVPEYAHGIPGAFKNALDWTVGTGSLYAKPVAVLDVAHGSRGGYVRAALDDVFGAMQSDVVRYAVPVTAADRDADGELAGPAVLEAVREVVTDFARRIGAHAAV
jgi:NAD(P)H-dependent FMN reductase